MPQENVSDLFQGGVNEDGKPKLYSETYVCMMPGAFLKTVS